MEIPKVGLGKFILICADLMTGEILNNDGSRYVGKGEQYYQVFDKKENAIDKALEVINSDKVEVLLYDGNGDFLKIFRK